ncbi:hypothetical protein H0H81_010052, partial [Sphagnurus paluster]
MNTIAKSSGTLPFGSLAHPSYSADVKLAGVIYLHGINQNCMLGTATVRKNLDMFQKLCGDQATENTVLVTSKWGSILKFVGIAREKQLQDQDWKQMCREGSWMARWNPPEDNAHKIVKSIIGTELASRGAFEIQRRLVNVDKLLMVTSVGQALTSTLAELLKSQRLMSGRLRGDERRDEVYQQIKENDQKIQNTLKKIESLELSWIDAIRFHEEKPQDKFRMHMGELSACECPQNQERITDKLLDCKELEKKLEKKQKTIQELEEKDFIAQELLCNQLNEVTAQLHEAQTQILDNRQQLQKKLEKGEKKIQELEQKNSLSEMTQELLQQQLNEVTARLDETKAQLLKTASDAETSNVEK